MLGKSFPACQQTARCLAIKFMQYLLEHFAVSIAAITGVLAARGKQVDLFGVLVLALVTAFGGGTVAMCCSATCRCSGWRTRVLSSMPPQAP